MVGWLSLRVVDGWAGEEDATLCGVDAKVVHQVSWLRAARQGLQGNRGLSVTSSSSSGRVQPVTPAIMRELINQILSFLRLLLIALHDLRSSCVLVLP